MKNQPIFYLSLCVLICLLSCKPNNDGKPSVALVKGGEIILPYKQPILNASQTIVRNFYDKRAGKEYITLWDNYKNQMIVFDLKEGQVINTLKYSYLFNDQDGIDDYYIQSWDSVFFLSRNTKQIALSDTSKKTLKIWHPNLTEEDGKHNLGFYTLGNLVYQKGNIYALNATNVGNVLNEKDRKKWFSQNNGAIINIEGNEALVDNKTGAFPKQIKENFYNVYNPRTAVNSKEDYIFSFGPLPELYIYNHAGELTIKETPSKFHKEIKPMPIESIQNQQFTERYSLESPSYADIKYDKYRNLYYRAFLHGINYENEDGTINTFDQMKWSLMILDADFKVIGEQEFNAEDFTFRNFMVTKEGVLLWKNSKVPYKGSNLAGAIFKVEKI
jgi:hypothetical protein